MTLTDLIAACVGQTSLDPATVKGFLQTAPRYYQWGLLHGLNQAVLDRLATTDLFEFYLRQYLSGRHKTLHAVLRQVRVFTGNDPTTAACCIRYSLARLRHQLLGLKWYELLPRLAMARERIAMLLPPGPVQPAVTGWLSTFD